MITASSADVNKYANGDPDAVEFGLKGLSTDTKPTETFSGKNIKNGSTFYEIDTGDIYMYNQSTHTWVVQ